MKRLAIAIGLLAIGFAAATPARADFAVVKFATSGQCRVWTNTAVAPPDGHFIWWHVSWPHPHWYYRLPTWAAAEHKFVASSALVLSPADLGGADMTITSA